MSQALFNTELTIDQIADAKWVLNKALAQSRQDHSTIEINLIHVTECDASGLQLLLALGCSAKMIATTVALKAPSASIMQMLDKYQLSERFIIAKE